MSFFSCLSCSWLSFPLVRRLDRSVKTQIPKKTAWITCTEGKHTLEHIFIFLCSFSNLFFSWTEKTSPSAEGRSDTGMHEEYCHRTDMGSGNRSVSSIWVEFIHIKVNRKVKSVLQSGASTGGIHVSGRTIPEVAFHPQLRYVSPAGNGTAATPSCVTLYSSSPKQLPLRQKSEECSLWEEGKETERSISFPSDRRSLLEILPVPDTPPKGKGSAWDFLTDTVHGPGVSKSISTSSQVVMIERESCRSYSLTFPDGSLSFFFSTFPFLHLRICVQYKTFCDIKSLV